MVVPVRVITHVHTRYSTGVASEMDPVIGGAIRRIMGGRALPDAWTESFTPVSALLELVRRPERERPVGIVVVTDHMNSRAHALPEELLWAAASEPRLAVGAELACAEPDGDGVPRRSPEVLVYGGPDAAPGPHGAYHGVSQATLDEMYRLCRADGSAELQTSRVMGYCEAHGMAYALAHPFDGHELSVERMVDLVSRARFVEVVNGGFPPEGARFLGALVELQNAVVRGSGLSAPAGEYWPSAAEFVRRTRVERRGLLHPWGGSDAHVQDFDRVVVRYLADRPDPSAGDLFRSMVERPVGELLARGTFRIEGRPSTGMEVLDDVLRIVAKNLLRYVPALAGSPRVAVAMLLETARITRSELARRSERRAALLREVERHFPAEVLLSWLQPGVTRLATDSAGLGHGILATTEADRPRVAEVVTLRPGRSRGGAGRAAGPAFWQAGRPRVDRRPPAERP